jgi:hypothetical protein
VNVGCGTGIVARYLSLRWSIPTYAVDRSPAMLAVAMQNCTGCEVGLLQQDIRCLQQPKPVDLVTADLDTLNGLLNGPDLKRPFRSHLCKPPAWGYFIVDLITSCQAQDSDLVRKKRLPGTAHEPRQQILWDSLRRLVFTTVVFQKPGSISLVSDRHVERLYGLSQVARWLRAAAFVIRDILDARTLRIDAGCPQRIMMVAQKGPIGKEGAE